MSTLTSKNSRGTQYLQAEAAEPHPDVTEVNPRAQPRELRNSLLGDTRRPGPSRSLCVQFRKPGVERHRDVLGQKEPALDESVGRRAQVVPVRRR